MNKFYCAKASDALIDKSIYLLENEIITKREHQINMMLILKNIPQIEFNDENYEIFNDLLDLSPDTNDIRIVISSILSLTSSIIRLN